MACVLSGMATTILILYPPLEASAFLRFRAGQRLISMTFHRAMRAFFGLRISVQGVPASTRPLMVVANHTSWLDIIVITSVLPAIFVTQHEVASWPIFGRLAKLSPSIFVNRDRKLEVYKTINSMSDALRANEIVAFFPEGTSSDGAGVLPFRSALFGSVRETLRQAENLPAIIVQPVSVAYVGANRRTAVWAREDEIPFVPHLFQVLGLRRIEVALTWGAPAPVDMSSDRKAIASRLEGIIRQLTVEATNRESPRVTTAPS